MMSSDPVAVDLFSGIGGLSLGLQSAGFRVATAVEVRKAAATSYAANFKNTVVLNRDIREISADDLTLGAKIKIDLLAACPPCQGFTSLNRFSTDADPRNSLVDEVARLVSELRPGAVMFENVARMIEGKKGRGRFDTMVQTLEMLGYKISWFVADAADFGTAQHRRRLILFGSHTEVIPPRPTHGEKRKQSHRTVRSALTVASQPKIFEKRDGKVRQLTQWHVVRRLGKSNLDRLTAARPGGFRSELPEHLRPNCHKGSQHGFRNSYGRMEWDKPSPTITSGCTSPSKGRFGHPDELRTISVREAALLQDFPSKFKIATGSIDEACELIGNAFPSRLAAAAAKAVLKAL